MRQVRAVAATAWGGLNGIRVIDVPSRAPGSGEVVVDVRATGITPFDYKRAQGMVAPGETLPLRLGNEAAGVVTAVGADPIGFEGGLLSIGDEVFGHWIPGAQAAELTISADLLLRKPSKLSFPQAAGLLGSGTAAWHALDVAAVGEGDVVLIHGVSGSVGGVAAQLARLRGARRVIGTAALRRHDALRRVGIEPVAYGPGLVDRLRHAIGSDQANAAIDTAGTDEAITSSVALVRDRSRIVSIANFRGASAFGVHALGPGAETERVRTAARSELTRLAAAGDLVIDIAGEYPLDEARAAYAVLAGGHAGGKLVLVPS